jgi:glycosyltransferase involved in cell wall biosynthesis
LSLAKWAQSEGSSIDAFLTLSALALSDFSAADRRLAALHRPCSSAHLSQTAMTSLTKLPVSVLIPAKDEEANLPACLASVARADEIFVVDSHSSDRSIAISESHGATVVQFEFDGGWPKKKNWSLENLPFRNEWVLIVDCDERITPELWDEIALAIENPEYEGYYLNRKVFFLGQWIRFGGKYPDWNLRLFKHKLGRYENLGTEGIRNTGDNEIHEHVIMPGCKVGHLKQDMLHIDFRDMYQWLARHNRYSNWEAQVYLNVLSGQANDGTIGANLFGTAVQRKRFLKKIWVRLPFKPFLRFVLAYILRLGFLDGQAGYMYARLLSQYEYQIGVKLFELQKFGGTLNQSAAPSLPPTLQPEA